jgi:putative DNA primase/helicase
VSTTNPIGQFYRGTQRPPRREPEAERDHPPKIEFTTPWPGTPADIPGNAPEFSPTDLGNARRLAFASGADIRYCFSMKKWFIWSGRLWVQDDTGEMLRKAKDTVRAILTEAAMAADDAERKRLVAHEQRSEARTKIEAMVALAQSEPNIPIRLAQLDAEPNLFNLANGVLNLQIGQLLDHHRLDYLTKISSIELDPKATCPLWDKFLSEIFPAPGVAKFVRRAAGYSLTPSTAEHCFFLLHGTGANGKSTLLEVLRYVFGDYALAADFATFLVQKGQAIRNDIARLRGARLVTAVESGLGGRLAENIVKILTGGEGRVTGRFSRIPGKITGGQNFGEEHSNLTIGMSW